LHARARPLAQGTAAAFPDARDALGGEATAQDQGQRAVAALLDVELCAVALGAGHARRSLRAAGGAATAWRSRGFGASGVLRPRVRVPPKPAPCAAWGGHAVPGARSGASGVRTRAPAPSGPSPGAAGRRHVACAPGPRACTALALGGGALPLRRVREIGRASCREGVARPGGR